MMHYKSCTLSQLSLPFSLNCQMIIPLQYLNVHTMSSSDRSTMVHHIVNIFILMNKCMKCVTLYKRQTEMLILQACKLPRKLVQLIKCEGWWNVTSSLPEQTHRSCTQTVPLQSGVSGSCASSQDSSWSVDMSLSWAPWCNAATSSHTLMASSKVRSFGVVHCEARPCAQKLVAWSATKIFVLAFRCLVASTTELMDMPPPHLLQQNF